MRPECEAELSCLLLVVTGRLGGLPGGRLAVWGDLPMEGCGELETDKQQGCLHTQGASGCPQEARQAGLR